ncbi:NAD kinase [Nostocoides sp. F2B08]|uniref:NAD kinase n=1 Tax=Nostocoides sp. F2B08 TaxID=2653936 RepID=UPI001D058277|nr:NAD kinase [Tetrasphaera sp. F2B08]
MATTNTERRVLIVGHPRRSDIPDLARTVLDRLDVDGMGGMMLAAEAERLGLQDHPATRIADPAAPASGCEVVCVLGGDGTILWAAELAWGSGVPLLGVNLGHVGFLAEAEREELDATVDRIAARDYAVEERLALEVVGMLDGEVFYRGWALNEVSIEKAARERMLELTVEVDGRPLSTWGCDGVIVATPTGSTAYAFSAGGPVVWPDVEALLLVPLSAHALFSRPLVVGPASVLAVEIIPDTKGCGVVWADGRRSIDLPPGARFEVRRSPDRIRFARLSSAPFTDRLVAKFDLSVHGWRGRGRSSAQ